MKNSTRRQVALSAYICALLPLCAQAQQDEQSIWAEGKPLNEVWLNPGMVSYHYRRDQDRNDGNYGLGAEYRFSTVASVTAGRYFNSDRAYSNYAGLYYQPLALGPVRLGLAGGAIDGYPRMRHGGWFPVLFPVASFEYKRFGLNLLVIPPYKNKVFGVLSLQLKIKVFD